MPPSNPQLAKAVGEALEKLAVAFPGSTAAKNPRMGMDVYCIGLEGVALDSIDRAVNRCIKQGTFFPKPAELRESCLTIMREDLANKPAWVHRTANETNARVCVACGDERDWKAFAAPPEWIAKRNHGEDHVFERLMCRCEVRSHVEQGFVPLSQHEYQPRRKAELERDMAYVRRVPLSESLPAA